MNRTAVVSVRISDLPEVKALVERLQGERDAAHREVAALQAKERRFHHPWHMDGWACFGTDDAPTVRRLAPEGEGDRWAPEEVTHGVASIEVASYGDHPGGCFLNVSGPDRASVVAAYERAHAAFSVSAITTWGGVDR